MNIFYKLPGGSSVTASFDFYRNGTSLSSASSWDEMRQRGSGYTVDSLGIMMQKNQNPKNRHKG